MTDDHANGVTEDDFEAEEAYDDEGCYFYLVA